MRTCEWHRILKALPKLLVTFTAHYFKVSKPMQLRLLTIQRESARERTTPQLRLPTPHLYIIHIYRERERASERARERERERERD
jgi:hypothetical protein